MHGSVGAGPDPCDWWRSIAQARRKGSDDATNVVGVDQRPAGIAIRPQVTHDADGIVDEALDGHSRATSARPEGPAFVASASAPSRSRVSSRRKMSYASDARFSSCWRSQNAWSLVATSAAGVATG